LAYAAEAAAPRVGSSAAAAAAAPLELIDLLLRGRCRRPPASNKFPFARLPFILAALLALPGNFIIFFF